jgi:hypothetical protein
LYNTKLLLSVFIGNIQGTVENALELQNGWLKVIISAL